MALIACKECKVQISDAAPMCPQCGVAHPALTGTGQVTILRQARTTGSFHPVQVIVDGEQVGELRDGGRITLDLAQGTHVVEVAGGGLQLVPVSETPLLRMHRRAVLILGLVGLLLLAGCGSGGAGGGNSTPTAAITSVAVSCTPASLQTGQTSQCSATVTGTGSYSSAVTWSVSPSSMGSISSAGIFTSSATGTATITATSAQDSTKSGSSTVTVSAPPTITSVNVSCSPSTVPEGENSQCTATVQGTGNFDPTVTWTASLGVVVSATAETATYTAPSSPTGSSIVTATSTQDTTKSGNTTLIVTRAPPAGSWQESGPPGAQNISAIAEDPGSPNIIYADGINAVTAGSLWKSLDYGSTWTPMITDSYVDEGAVSDIAVVNGGQVLYAAGGDGAYFYASTDSGTTWTSIQVASGNALMNGMAIDPSSYSTIYLSVPGDGVFKSQDNGNTWTLLSASPIITAQSGNAALHAAILVDPTNTDRLYYGTDHGLYISQDAGATWTTSTNGIASTDVSIRDVASDPASPSTIYILAGVEVSTSVDLYRSTNGGALWTPLATNLDALRIVPDPNTASTLYLDGFVCHSVYKSIDAGMTFVASDSGTPSSGNSCGGGPVQISGSSNSTMIPLASGPGNFLLDVNGVGLYKTQNAAQSWSLSSQGLSGWNGMEVVVDPNSPSTLYFGAANSGGIFKSTDAGKTWVNISTAQANAIAVDPFDSTHVLAASWGPDSTEAGLLESHDGGNTWTNVSSRLPAPPPTTFVLITGINFYSAKQGTIFILTRGMGTIRSTDNGQTYATDNTGLSSTNVYGCLAVNPSNPQALFIVDDVGTATSIDAGNTWTETKLTQPNNASCNLSVDAKASPPLLYNFGTRSSDFGNTWTSLTPPIAGGSISAIIVDPSTANSIFAIATSTNGVNKLFWSPDAGITWYPAPNGDLGMSILDAAGWNSQTGEGSVIVQTTPQILFVPSWTNSVLSYEVGP